MTIPDHEVARRRSRLSLFRGNWRRGYAPVEIFFLSPSGGAVARRQAAQDSDVYSADRQSNGAFHGCAGIEDLIAMKWPRLFVVMAVLSRVVALLRGG